MGLLVGSVDETKAGVLVGLQLLGVLEGQVLGMILGLVVGIRDSRLGSVVGRFVCCDGGNSCDDFGLTKVGTISLGSAVGISGLLEGFKVEASVGDTEGLGDKYNDGTRLVGLTEVWIDG